jgi:hypothetical protein
MRVLIAVTLRMYREAIALYLYQQRSRFEVRTVPPHALEEQVWSFRPHLILSSDGYEFDPRLMAGVICWVEVLYSDTMDVKVHMDGRVSRVKDMNTRDLLAVLDETEKLVPGETAV